MRQIEDKCKGSTVRSSGEGGKMLKKVCASRLEMLYERKMLAGMKEKV